MPMACSNLIFGGGLIASNVMEISRVGGQIMISTVETAFELILIKRLLKIEDLQFFVLHEVDQIIQRKLGGDIYVVRLQYNFLLIYFELLNN